MNQPPRHSSTSLFSRPFALLIGWQSVMLAAIGLGVYGWALSVYGPGSHSQTIALFSLISIQLGHTFNCRSRSHSAFDGIFKNRFLWFAFAIVVGLQILAIHFSGLATILGTVKPTPTDLGVIAISGLIPIAVVEIVKLGFRQRMRFIPARGSLLY